MDFLSKLVIIRIIPLYIINISWFKSDIFREDHNDEFLPSTEANKPS